MCRIASLWIALYLLCFPALAGKFNRKLGLSSDTITLEVPRPPDAFPQVKSIGVKIAETDNRFTGHSQMKLQLEQAISGEFRVSEPKPEAVMTITVSRYDPVRIDRETRKESETVKVNGKSETRDKMVDYLIGVGNLQVRVELIDAQGVPLDTFSPQAAFREERRADQSSTSSSAKILGVPAGPLGGKAKTEALRWAHPEDILSLLFEALAQQVKRRYIKTTDPVTFKLAVDDTLRPGNKLAMSSPPDWDGALKAWEAAKTKNQEEEADQQYNLAVGHEALAYKAYNATLNPNDAMPFFERSLTKYQKAKELDPNEKYIVNAQERLNLAKNNIGRAVDQRKAYELERQKLRDDFVARREGQRALQIERADTPEERNFRTIVRALIDANPKVDFNSLEARGQRMNLPELSVKYVLFREQERLKNMALYDDDLKTFVADGKLSLAERKALEAMLPSTKLTAEDAKVIEGRYKFEDESAPPPPPPPPPPAPAPVVAPPKPAAVKAAPRPAPKSPVPPAKKP